MVWFISHSTLVVGTWIKLPMLCSRVEVGEMDLAPQYDHHISKKMAMAEVICAVYG